MRSPSVTSPYAPDLAAVRAWLEDMIAKLRFLDLVAAIMVLLTRMRDVNTELVARIADLKRRRPPSETLERLERQLVLPLFAAAAATSKPSKEKKTRERNKARDGGPGGRGAFPAHLPRVPVPNDVAPEQRMCPECGALMTRVGVSTCTMLHVIPAKVVVLERHDETVACPNDDTIVSAPVPAQIVERGKLSDALLVEAVADKYLDHLPVERQCARFARLGVDVSQTLGRGVCAALDLFAPVADLIATLTRGPGLLGTDASRIPILDPVDPAGIRSGTMWCWTNARWVSFFYAKAGDSQSVRDFLGDDLARTVQCDGTTVTTFLERHGGKRPGCWAHARRGFVKAARSGDAVALEVVRLIAPLFAIERAATRAGDTAVERRARRERDTRPVLDALRAYCDVQRDITPPSTPLGTALGYLHRQWNRLVLFVEDGNIEATNNRRERELRRLVLGRKNWLFTWLDVGAERTANILSILATCIAHDVNPRAYLHVLARLLVQGWPNARLRELLPDRILALHPELAVADDHDLALSG